MKAKSVQIFLTDTDRQAFDMLLEFVDEKSIEEVLAKLMFKHIIETMNLQPAGAAAAKAGYDRDMINSVTFRQGYDSVDAEVTARAVAIRRERISRERVKALHSKKAAA